MFFLMIHNSIHFSIIRVEPAQPIFFSEIRVDLAQLDNFFKHSSWAGLTRFFFHKFESSRLNPNFDFLWLNSKNVKKMGFGRTVRMSSGVLRVARGGSGAKAPPLAARPKVEISTGGVETCWLGWQFLNGLFVVKCAFNVFLILYPLIFPHFTSHFSDFFSDRTSHFLLFPHFFLRSDKVLLRLQGVAIPNIPVWRSYSTPIWDRTMNEVRSQKKWKK